MPIEQQKRFAFEYLFDFNATKAAIRAGYSEKSAHDQGSKLLKYPAVQAEIEALKEMHARVASFSRAKYIDILIQRAIADPRKLVESIVKPCIKCWPEGLVMDEPNKACEVCKGEGMSFVRIIDSRKITGPERWLIAGYEQKKDGVKVHMHDQNAALKMLGDVMGWNVQRTETSGPGGGPIQLSAVTDVKQLTDEQLEQLCRLGIDSGVSSEKDSVTIEGKLLTSEVRLPG